MRRVCLMLLAAMVLLGCERTPETSPVPPAAGAGDATITFDVTGMTCEGCQATVTSAIAEVEGVRGVTVSLKDNTATVAYDAAGAPSAEAISAAVKAKGYEATPQ